MILVCGEIQVPLGWRMSLSAPTPAVRWKALPTSPLPHGNNALHATKCKGFYDVVSTSLHETCFLIVG